MEQTQAGVAVRLDKAEANITAMADVDVKAEVKAEVRTALVQYESNKTENDSSVGKIVNDIKPWLWYMFGTLALILIALAVVCLVIGYWIVHRNSYLVQKPKWERKMNYYVIDKTEGRNLTAVVQAEYSTVMSRLIGTEQDLPPVCQGDAFVLKDWLIERGFVWSQDFYIRRAGEQFRQDAEKNLSVANDSKGMDKGTG